MSIKKDTTIIIIIHKKKKKIYNFLLVNHSNEKNLTHKTIEYNYNNRTFYYILYNVFIHFHCCYCIIKFYQKTGRVVQQTPETDGETPL